VNTTLIEPVVKAIEHLSWAAWAAPDRGAVADYISEARHALTLALADEDVRGWATFVAHHRCTLAVRRLDHEHETGKAGRRHDVVHKRLVAASTALVRCADAHLHALTWADTDSGALTASDGPGVVRGTPEPSQPRRRRSTRGNDGGRSS
jgi:hypothetical protein